MASLMASGLSGGAASNNINVLIFMTGRTHFRATDRKAGSTAARALLSRRSVDNHTVTTPYTLKTS